MGQDDAGSRFLLESWLELNEAATRRPELRELLFDPVTGLPTTPLLFPRIRALLDDRGEASVLCLNIVGYTRNEDLHGWRAFDEVMQNVSQTLERITGSALRDSDMVAELVASGNSFVIVLSPPRDSMSIAPANLEALTRRVEECVRQDLAQSLDASLRSKFGCYAGSSTIKADAGGRIEDLVYEGLRLALDRAAAGEVADSAERTRRITEIIDREEIRTLVHPVIDLVAMKVIGYEALSRGPEDGEFERPDKLFKIAHDSDLVVRLERLCRRRAIQAASKLPPGRLLFLNIEPDAVIDPELREAMFASILAETSITQDRLVLEVAEGVAFADFAAFRSTVEYLRTLGFAVAVDDVGAGYGSFQIIKDIRPDWLKIDMSLVRGVDSDQAHSQLVRSLVVLADQIGVRLVAEGIETRKELAALRALGVRYGQGFLFSQPALPFPADGQVTLQ